MKRSRTNLFLTLALFTVIFGLVGSSFYMWYTQEVSATVVRSTDTGAQFWTTLASWSHNLGPKLAVFADTVYQYLLALAYKTKLNLLWKYRHKITVLSITGLVVGLLLLFLISLWISYALGKRKGKRAVLSDDRTSKKKR